MDLDKLKKEIIKADINVDISTKELCFSLHILLSPYSLKNCFFSISGGCVFFPCSESCAKGCAIQKAQD